MQLDSLKNEESLIHICCLLNDSVRKSIRHMKWMPKLVQCCILYGALAECFSLAVGVAAVAGERGARV
jgi:hypothetical protein